jgi:diguanylate cyclase (GGDEF)-like protein/PAS domain S-box-containing protein
MNAYGPAILAALIAVAFAVAWVYSRYALREYRDRADRLHAEVVEAAANAGFGRRVEGVDDVLLDRLGTAFNQLFEALEAKDTQSRQGEELFLELANVMPEVVLVHTDTIVFANERAAELLGVPAAELVGRAVLDLIRPAYRKFATEIINQQLESDTNGASYELQLIDGDEQARWAEATGKRISFRGRTVVLTVARDITYRKSVEAALSRGRQQAQITLESLGEGVITTDTDTVIDYMNAAAEKLTGVARESGVGQPFADVVKLVDEGDRRNLDNPVARALQQGSRVTMGRRALLMQSGGSAEFSIDAAASPIVAPDRSVTGCVVMLRDVSELRGMAREMSYQATHDALTGLINRREFERQVNTAIEAARKDDEHHVLCYLDLDRFKVVNDTCGHAAGDNLLREIASKLRHQVRDSDVVARQGGDEFGMLLVGCPLPKARQIAEDVCSTVRNYRFTWQDKIFDIGVSIGLVEISNQSSSLEDVLSAADSACYVAKQRGRGRVHVYSARDEIAARQRGEIHWLRKLQTALRENSFELYVQPIISLAGRIPRGPATEVLVRLRDEAEGLVLPREFIPAAERYQLIGAVDRWVLQTALAAVASGTIRLPDARSVAINISGQTMAEEGFLDFVVEALDHTGVNPEQVCFEVRESSVLRDIEHARRFIGVLHGMGCTFGLDDFGSDVGSLASLQGLGIDFLKLDGSCTRNLIVDSVNHELVAAVTRLSRAVGFKVVAEQVEEELTFTSLRQLGVNFIQGNYVEPPRALGSQSAAS